ncbi:hypothetical protein MCEMOHM34_00745 [Candidatus Methylopumilus universalis]|uniref:hypothetical protein n=1 Tax=Candidatus Methylopumilus universalis TaxID=2588536 RepID=UPI003BEEC8FE
MRVKSLIFSLCLLGPLTADAQDMKAVYEANKNKVKVDQAVDVEGYLFSSSISKADTTVDVLIDKNKMIATSRLLDYPMTMIKWPKQLSEDLKATLWHHYIRVTNKNNLSGVLIIDNGQIGKNYYVVVGVASSKVGLDNVTYENILESLR